MSAEAIEHTIHEQFRAYRATLRDDQRQLLERFEIVDVARKVVGVGSVGTGAYIVLLQGRDQQDPLFLQVKEATQSVLEDHLPKSRYKQAGERVVHGQRMMQASSDIFLGWTKGERADRYLYWRQLRDMKGSAVIETMSPEALTFYGRICGHTLARAHARSGDPIAIAAYLGKKRPVRPVDHRLLRTLRRPKRAGLPGVHRSHPNRPTASTRRCLIARRPPPGVSASRRPQGRLRLLVGSNVENDAAAAQATAHDWSTQQCGPTCPRNVHQPGGFVHIRRTGRTAGAREVPGSGTERHALNTPTPEPASLGVKRSEVQILSARLQR